MSNGRKVSTDALETLGTVIGENEKRDAIHLAVEPVIAGVDLNPGQHIQITNGRAFPSAIGGGHGIVDPFLHDYVNAGQRFWFVMYPRAVTSLRHVWSHPAFPDEAGVVAETSRDKVASEKWLRDFCASADCPGYEDLISLVTGGSDKYGASAHFDGEYLFFSQADAHGEIPPEFWDHLEVVTGQKFPERPTYFSCSC